jgi:hypothetical protein
MEEPEASEVPKVPDVPRFFDVSEVRKESNIPKVPEVGEGTKNRPKPALFPKKLRGLFPGFAALINEVHPFDHQAGGFLPK